MIFYYIICYCIFYLFIYFYVITWCTEPYATLKSKMKLTGRIKIRRETISSYLTSEYEALIKSYGKLTYYIEKP